MDREDITSSSSVESTLFAQHVQSVNNIYELQSAIHTLTIDNQKSLIRYRNAVSNHENQRAALAKQIEELQAVNSRLSQQKEVLVASLESLKQEHEELKKSHQELERIVAIIPSQGVSPILTAMALERSRRGQQQARKESQDLQDELRNVTRNLQDSKSELQALRSNSERQIAEFQQVIAVNLETHHHELQRLHAQYKSQTHTLSDQLNFQKEVTKALEAENSVLISQLGRLQRAANNCPAIETPVTPSASRQNQKYQQLLSRFDNLIEEHNLTLQSERVLSKELENIKRLCRNYQQEIASLEKRLANACPQFRVINFSAMPTVSEYMQPLLQEISQLRSRLAEQEKMRSIQEKRSRDLTEQLEELELREVKHYRREIEHLQKAQKQCEFRLSEAQNKLQQREHEIQEATSHNIKVQSRNRDLEERVKEMEMEIGNLRTMPARSTLCQKCYTFESSLEEKLRQLQTENKKLWAIKAQNAEALQQLDSQLLALREGKFEKERELTAVFAQMKEMQKTIRDQKEQIIKRKEQQYQLEQPRQQQHRPEEPEAHSLFDKHRENESEIEEKSVTQKIGRSREQIWCEGEMNLGNLETLRENRRARTERPPQEREMMKIENRIHALRRENKELRVSLLE